jgi:glycosyltransferase involved in cell wall biosynthesis
VSPEPTGAPEVAGGPVGDARRDPPRRRLSILVPVYNERRTLAAVIARIRAADLAGLEREILLVDDGSTDGTRELLPDLAGADCRVILHTVNRGKGAAVRTALAAATGDLAIIQDADLEYDPGDYRILLGPALAGARCVYGSRFAGGGPQNMSPVTALANRFLTWLTRLLYGLTLTDMETCYKLVETDLLRSLRLRATGFELEPEITLKLARRGVAIVEVPIRYTGRSRAEGKKIGIKDGMAAIWTLIKYRFGGP